MKRFISFLTVIISSAILCACNTKSLPVVTENVHNETNTAVTTTSKVQNADTQTTLKALTDPTSVTIEETLLIDESGIKITAKRLDFSKSLGPALIVLIENNSGNDLIFQCRKSSVNGYMIDTIMSENVSNGKKSNASIIFNADDLKICNISTIADIELTFTAFGFDIEESYLENTKVRLKTSDADTYEYKFDDSGNLIYDENNLKIVSKGITRKNQQTYLVVYIENNTENDFTVQVRDTSVNGFMIKPIFSPVVSGGKRLMGFISFDDSELAENDIEEISDVETSFLFFELGKNSSGLRTDILKIKV